jgi:hypothetical protein
MKMFSLGGVLERDLDVLLAAHLTASEQFRALVMRRAWGEALSHALHSCQVSVSTDAGETNLLLIVQLEGRSSSRLALM